MANMHKEDVKYCQGKEEMGKKADRRSKCRKPKNQGKPYELHHNKVTHSK